MDDALFFVCDGAQYYLLPSLRDAAMVQGMGDLDNLISVLKAGFPKFDKEIVQRIATMYSGVRK